MTAVKDFIQNIIDLSEMCYRDDEIGKGAEEELDNIQGDVSFRRVVYQNLNDSENERQLRIVAIYDNNKEDTMPDSCWLEIWDGEEYSRYTPRIQGRQEELENILRLPDIFNLVDAD